MRLKKIITVFAVAALMCNTVSFASSDETSVRIDRKPGDSVWLGDYAESAKETQGLIDNRPDLQRQMENIGRGVVAVKTDNGVFISWRWLGTESEAIKYNVYRDNVKLNAEPLNATNYTDINPVAGAKYSVAAVVNGVEKEKSEAVAAWNKTEGYDAGYFDIPLKAPDPIEKEDRTVQYNPSDLSVADLDGDGEYEFILKWDPSDARDAGSGGFTSECILDAYELDGTQMWRVHMGKNIRSGPHDTQFIVYDFDNDGKAEMACRTADGTVAGDGTVIGDPKADWASLNDGKNLQGPLYVTVFNGTDGSVIDTTDYYPQSTGKLSNGKTWDISSFGDDWGNRSERYLGALGSFDGEHTSFVLARGYYDRSCMAAYHLEDGKIVQDWKFDTSEGYTHDETGKWYTGQGNHNMATADVDYDGKDEIIYGSLAVDHDGKALYTTELGHGDAQHVGDLLPSRPGLEVYSCHESGGSKYGYEMRDARTGEILYGEFTGNDNGRAGTADIDPNYEGEEAWSAAGILTSADGTVISANYDYSIPANFAAWWDGDLGREIQDGISISKWDYINQTLNPVFRGEDCKSINAAKSNPLLTADIFGDWREETIYPLKDNSAMRIYTTTIPTGYRIPTLMHDTQYRNHVALQNVCYNQPTHTSFFLGYGAKTIPVPQMYTVDKDGNKQLNPDLSKKAWDVADLYTGESIEMVLDSATALVKGVPERVDNNNKDVKAILNEDDRTLVPLRFIAEAFGAGVEYDEPTRGITISYGNTTIKLTCDSDQYSVTAGDKTEAKIMDTKPVVQNDRTLVPIRTISESLGKNVGYYDGLIIISDLEPALETEAAKARKAEILSLPTPAEKKPAVIDETKATLKYLSMTDNEKSDKAVLAGDGDVSTAWTCDKPDSLVIEFDGWPGTPGVLVRFADEKVHNFSIEYSSDAEKWLEVLPPRESKGKGEYEKYIYGCPKYPKYVRLNILDEEGASVSEFAGLIVE